MANRLDIEIGVVYSKPDTDPSEFRGIITRSRNDAVGEVMTEVLKVIRETIPHDSICSVVIGSKLVGSKTV
jgi:hypothetical protein